MANRTFTLPGIWASTATTTIPTPPIAGVTYRSTSLAGVIADGWPFSRVVASEDMNQLLWLATQLLAQLDASRDLDGATIGSSDAPATIVVVAAAVVVAVAADAAAADVTSVVNY